MPRAQFPQMEFHKNAEPNSQLFVCWLSAVASQTGGVSSTSLLALVCEYGMTHYDEWSNYVSVRPL